MNPCARALTTLRRGGEEDGAGGGGQVVREAQAQGARLHQGQEAHQEGQEDLPQQEVRQDD